MLRHTPRLKVVRDESGNRVAVECGDYFDQPPGRIEEWIFGAAPEELKRKLPKFRVPRFFRTLSSWLNMLLDAGLFLERFEEPYADDDTVRRCPHLAGTRVAAYYLHVRCRKAA